MFDSVSSVLDNARIRGNAVVGSEPLTRFQKRVRTEFGRRVKDMRQSKEMSQADLAKTAKIRRALISEIEHGLANPTMDTIASIAAALDVGPGELLSLER